MYEKDIERMSPMYKRRQQQYKLIPSSSLQPPCKQNPKKKFSTVIKDLSPTIQNSQ